MLVASLIVLLLVIWSLLAAATDRWGGVKTAVIVTDIALLLMLVLGSGIIKIG